MEIQYWDQNDPHSHRNFNVVELGGEGGRKDIQGLNKQTNMVIQDTWKFYRENNIV